MCRKKVTYIATHDNPFQLAGMLGPVELPFNGCPPDACNSLSTGSCPTQVGDTLVYELDFEVNSIKPACEAFSFSKIVSQLLILSFKQSL